MNNKNSRISPQRDDWNFAQTSQPGGNMREWSHERCSCCEDMGECCCAFLCSPCFICRTFSRAEEHCCSCLFGGIVPLRTKIRLEKKIRV
jgi:hypothetical protein